MYSQKQIEALAKQVADTEIGEAIIHPEQLESSKMGLLYFADDFIGDVLETTDEDAGKLVGVDENGYPSLVDTADVDLKVKTIEQSEANWSADLSSVIFDFAPSSLVCSNIFSRLQKINGELEIIMTFSVNNPTESAITPTYVSLGSFSIPQDIGIKIIDILGSRLIDSGEMTSIAGSRMVVGYDTTSVFNSQNGVLSISHNGANKMFICAYGMSSVPAGSTHYYSGRIQLTLL